MSLPPAQVAHAKQLLNDWLPLYPYDREIPWVNEKARVVRAESEDEWLRAFRGSTTLTLAQVTELIDWKWSSTHRRHGPVRRAVEADWPHAQRCIQNALALAPTDPDRAVDALRGPSGKAAKRPSSRPGLREWDTSTASVVLMACFPGSYTVADSRALRSVRRIEGESAEKAAKMGSHFPRQDWRSYLMFCRALRDELGRSLREIDRALGHPMAAIARDAERVIMEFWEAIPRRRVVHLRGVSAEAVELAVEAAGNGPALITYTATDLDGVPDTVSSLLAELDRAARGLIVQWLPRVRDLGGPSDEVRAAVHALAHKQAHEMDVPSALVTDLADRAMTGQNRTSLAAEVRADGLAKVIARSYGQDRLILLVDGPPRLTQGKAEVVTSACDWLVHHAPADVWLTGDVWKAVDRVVSVDVHLPADVAAIDVSKSVTDEEAAPRVTYPPVSGQPRWDSPAELALEDALARRPWAYGRAWNETYRFHPMANPIRIDLMWFAERCVVEVDGPEHRGMARFESDRRRDVLLQLDGFAVLRFTNRQIDHDVEAVVSQIERFITGRRTLTPGG